MGTKALGVVTLPINGHAYTVKFSINVLADAEESGDSENTILGAFGRIANNTHRLSDVRWLLWTGLRTEQPDTTIEGAGDLLEAAGVTPVLNALTEAFNNMMARSRPQTPAPHPAGSRSTKTRSRPGSTRSGSGRSRRGSSK